MNIIEWLKEQWQAFIGKSSPRDYLHEISPAQLKAWVDEFIGSEPGREWAQRVISGDPALNSLSEQDAMEQLIQYQGLHAIVMHGKAHKEYLAGEYTVARNISQAARRLTAGIEIHPGAKIDKNLFIDHGTGLVIGETAEVGKNVMLYHRVTLGNDGSNNTVERTDGETPRRHPKLGNNVVINTGAEVLGAATVSDNVTIGAGSKIIGKVEVGEWAEIGPGLVVRRNVPAGCKILDRYGNSDFNVFRVYVDGQSLEESGVKLDKSPFKMDDEELEFHKITIKQELLGMGHQVDKKKYQLSDDSWSWIRQVSDREQNGRR